MANSSGIVLVSEGLQRQSCHLRDGGLAIDDGLEHASEGDALALYDLGYDDQGTDIGQIALDVCALPCRCGQPGGDALVQLEQRALDFPLGQALVFEVEQESDEVKDLGALVLELIDVELRTTGPQLQDVGNLRHFAVGDHDGVADLLPHIDRVIGVHFEQIAPLPPGGGRNAALVLEPRQSVAEGFSHEFFWTRAGGKRMGKKL